MMESVKFIIIPETEWKQLLTYQQEILQLLREKQNVNTSNFPLNHYITAMEFMQAVKIGRTKFDQLVQTNKVKTIKKDRKIYVPMDEIEKYFK